MSRPRVPSVGFIVAEPVNLVPWSIIGNGLTTAEALAMAKSIADATIGVLQGNYQVIPVDAADLPTVASTGQFSDVVLELKKQSGGKIKRRSLFINNIDSSLTTAGGGVNAAAPKITAIVAAYRDEDGESGYSLYRGRVVQ